VSSVHDQRILHQIETGLRAYDRAFYRRFALGQSVLRWARPIGLMWMAAAASAAQVAPCRASRHRRRKASGQVRHRPRQVRRLGVAADSRQSRLEPGRPPRLGRTAAAARRSAVTRAEESSQPMAEPSERSQLPATRPPPSATRLAPKAAGAAHGQAWRPSLRRQARRSLPTAHRAKTSHARSANATGRIMPGRAST